MLCQFNIILQYKDNVSCDTNQGFCRIFLQNVCLYYHINADNTDNSCDFVTCRLVYEDCDVINVKINIDTTSPVRAGGVGDLYETNVNKNKYVVAFLDGYIAASLVADFTASGVEGGGADARVAHDARESGVGGYGVSAGGGAGVGFFPAAASPSCENASGFLRPRRE